MKNTILFIFITNIVFLFSGQFDLVLKSEGVKSLKFTSNQIELKDKDGYARIAIPEFGSTVDVKACLNFHFTLHFSKWNLVFLTMWNMR